MRRALAAVLVTLVAVVLLVRYETHAPRTVNPNSALAARATPRAIARPTHGRIVAAPGARIGTGPLVTTPFSTIQVRAQVRGGRVIGVQTVQLTGDGPHTEALNAHAEPILRREALRAGSADVDTVSGATYTSESWIDSLQKAIEDARGRPAARRG
jgi:uncharacterized protein with FMN-binding domain